MIQKNYCLKRDARIDFLGLNENIDHIWLEINKSALTKNYLVIRRKRFKIFGNKNLPTIWPSHEWPLPRNDNEM